MAWYWSRYKRLMYLWYHISVILWFHSWGVRARGRSFIPFCNSDEGVGASPSESDGQTSLSQGRAESMDDITVSISSTTADGQLELISSPYGASLRSLNVTSNSGDTHDVILGYSHKADKMGGQGDVLIPFPGRVGGGRYTFDGKEYQMELNDADGPNAI